MSAKERSNALLPGLHPRPVAAPVAGDPTVAPGANREPRPAVQGLRRLAGSPQGGAVT